MNPIVIQLLEINDWLFYVFSYHIISLHAFFLIKNIANNKNDEEAEKSDIVSLEMANNNDLRYSFHHNELVMLKDCTLKAFTV